jgi:hypothetical protein
MRWASALVMGLTCFGAPALAADEARPASLSWVRRAGAEECPTALFVAQRVEERLQRNVFVPASATDLSVEAYVERLPASWHVVISVSNAAGKTMGYRELSDAGPSCGVIAESAALAIALMIDPEAQLRRAPPPRTPTTAPEPAPPSAPQEMIAPPSTEATSDQRIVEVAAAFWGGLVPGFGPGVVARGGTSLPGRLLRLELEGGYLFPQAAEVQTNEGAKSAIGAKFAVALGGVDLCTLLAESIDVSFSTCAGVNAGSILARPYAPQTVDVQQFFMAFAARAHLRIRVVGGLRLALGADLDMPLWRDHFQMSAGLQTNDVFRQSAVAGGFEIGGAYAF